MRQTVWIMLTEDLYPRWELLPADWRRDIATALVEATEWMVKGQKILARGDQKATSHTSLREGEAIDWSDSASSCQLQ
jgi:hypothetical protein